MYTPRDVVKVHMGADDVVRESFRVDIFVEKVFEISSIATSIENDTFICPPQLWHKGMEIGRTYM